MLSGVIFGREIEISLRALDRSELSELKTGETKMTGRVNLVKENGRVIKRRKNIRQILLRDKSTLQIARERDALTVIIVSREPEEVLPAKHIDKVFNFIESRDSEELLERILIGNFCYDDVQRFIINAVGDLTADSPIPSELISIVWAAALSMYREKVTADRNKKQ